MAAAGCAGGAGVGRVQRRPCGTAEPAWLPPPRLLGLTGARARRTSLPVDAAATPDVAGSDVDGHPSGDCDSDTLCARLRAALCGAVPYVGDSAESEGESGEAATGAAGRWWWCGCCPTLAPAAASTGCSCEVSKRWICSRIEAIAGGGTAGAAASVRFCCGTKDGCFGSDGGGGGGAAVWCPLQPTVTMALASVFTKRCGSRSRRRCSSSRTST